jgi:transposase-like protein
MPKKLFSEFEKVGFVLASAQEGVVITDFCTRHRISRSSLYAWRKDVFKQLSRGLSPKKPRRPTA